MALTLSLYDQQASTFDRRAGLPQSECPQIAAAIEQLCGLEKGDIVVEIGCGTGQLGLRLAGMAGFYMGMDLSRAMLQQFLHRKGGESIFLAQADGNGTWPVADHRANLLFSSRAIHWIEITHIVNEIYRIASRGRAMFVVGRVERAPVCWESQLRKQCHHLLKQHQLTPLDGERHLTHLREEFSKRQANILSPVIAAQWFQKRSLQQALSDWENKPGLAGTAPSQQVKKSILAQLKNWAEENFGHDMPTESRRQYVLYGVKLFA